MLREQARVRPELAEMIAAASEFTAAWRASADACDRNKAIEAADARLGRLLGRMLGSLGSSDPLWRLGAAARLAPRACWLGNVELQSVLVLAEMAAELRTAAAGVPGAEAMEADLRTLLREHCLDRINAYAEWRKSPRCEAEKTRRELREMWEAMPADWQEARFRLNALRATWG